ncbi:MAG: fibrinogen-like YCDxxxxGGGW domain-containing protein [Polyangiaceae bacterium]|jgi:hypothetical protein
MCALLSTSACIALTGCSLAANLGEFDDAVAAAADSDSVADPLSGSSETGAPGDPTTGNGTYGQARDLGPADATAPPGGPDGGGGVTDAVAWSTSDPDQGAGMRVDAAGVISDAADALDAEGPTMDALGASVTLDGTVVSQPDGGPADGSQSDGPAFDSGPSQTSYASCLEILDAAPASSSATYVIFPAGTALEVYCDMDFAGGGWTLVQSTNGGSCAPATETAGPVALGSCAYVPYAAVTALAHVSTSVHVRPASGSAVPTAYITSATALPIENLRMGLVANANEAVGDAGAEEAAWTVVGDPGKATSQGRTPESILTFTCSVAGEMWPAVYHACGNGADGFALDVVDNVSYWNWGIMPRVNVPMEVYLR